MTTRDVMSIGSKDKPPVLFVKEFKIWKDRFIDYVERQENGEFIMHSLENGPMGIITRTGIATDGNPIPDIVTVLPIHYSAEQKKMYQGDKMAKSLIIQSLTDSVYRRVDSKNHSGKAMFDELIKLFQGSDVENQMRIANAINSYESFKQKDGEALDSAYERFTTILNEMSRFNLDRKMIEHNVKFLNVLQPEWKKYAHRMKQNAKLSELPLQEMFETLKQDEEDAEAKRGRKNQKYRREDKKEMKEGEKDPLALISNRKYSDDEGYQSEGELEEAGVIDEIERMKDSLALLTSKWLSQV